MLTSAAARIRPWQRSPATPRATTARPRGRASRPRSLRGGAGGRGRVAAGNTSAIALCECSSTPPPRARRLARPSKQNGSTPPRTKAVPRVVEERRHGGARAEGQRSQVRARANGQQQAREQRRDVKQRAHRGQGKAEAAVVAPAGRRKPLVGKVVDFGQTVAAKRVS